MTAVPAAASRRAAACCPRSRPGMREEDRGGRRRRRGADHRRGGRAVARQDLDRRPRRPRRRSPRCRTRTCGSARWSPGRVMIAHGRGGRFGRRRARSSPRSTAPARGPEAQARRPWRRPRPRSRTRGRTCSATSGCSSAASPPARKSKTRATSGGRRGRGGTGERGTRHRGPPARARRGPSPIAGQVVKRLVSVGEQVDGTAASRSWKSPTSTRVELAANVPAEQLARVHRRAVGGHRLDTYTDRVFPGTVVAIAPAVDPATNTTLARVRVTNRGRQLKVGMFAQARVGSIGTARAHSSFRRPRSSGTSRARRSTSSRERPTRTR